MLLWLHQAQAGMLYDNLSANQLWTRSTETVSCGGEVPGGGWAWAAATSAYFAAAGVYHDVMIKQLQAYLTRHNEVNQFLSEDASGVR
jgi:hypothetical protein